MSLRGEITCPCCGYQTLQTKGKYDVCSICYWEDDPYQRLETNDTGANPISLVDAQMNYLDFGASELTYLKNIRKPDSNDSKGADWIKYMP